MKLLFSASIFLVMVLFSAHESLGQKVTGSIGNGTVTKGRTVRAYIVLDIPKGLHVNSRYPRNEYLIPTTVNVSGRGITLSRVSYPAGKDRTYSYSDKPINVYEGRVVFGFNVTVPKNFSGNTVRVRALVKYQPCTDEVCYRPTTKDVTFKANVR